MEPALWSFVSSDLIEAFLKCYRVISHDVVIAADRRFNATEMFLTEQDLEYRISYINIEEPYSLGP